MFGAQRRLARRRLLYAIVWRILHNINKYLRWYFGNEGRRETYSSEAN